MTTKQKYRKVKKSSNRRVLYWLLVFQTVSFALLLVVTWVDEELILPRLDQWISFASPKVIAGMLESFWLILLFGSIIRWQYYSWSRIRLLEGLLPICSYCKKIRDPQGAWNQMEAYVSEKSGADFSHGICPSCIEVNFGDIMHKP